jgi:hypothetical protein
MVGQSLAEPITTPITGLVVTGRSYDAEPLLGEGSDGRVRATSGREGVCGEVDHDLNWSTVSAATDVWSHIASEVHNSASNREARDDHDYPLHGWAKERAALGVVALSAGGMTLRGRS